MAAFESQKVTARNLALSINSQLTPNDLFIDAKFTQRQRFKGDSVWESMPSVRSDKDMSGKGTEFATEGQVTLWDTKGSFKCEAEPFTLGWMFAFAFGADAVTGMGPYTHAFSIEESTSQAPMTNVYVEDTAAVKTKYQDLALTEFTITYDEKAAIMLDIAMAGTGRITDGAMMAGPPALATPTYLLNSDTVFSLGPQGALASMVGRVLSGSVKFQTGAVSHVAPGNGLYGCFMRLGLRKVGFDLVIAAKDTDDVRTLLIGDTMSAATVATNSERLRSSRLAFRHSS